MAVTSERPYSGANFLVTIGDADPYSVTAGFSEVIFPPFVLDPGRPHGRGAKPKADQGEAIAAGEPPVLVLRRGLIGSLDLYEWWDEWRRAEAPSRRILTVELLADDRRTVVMTWRFVDVWPVSLAYSPLRAAEGGIVTETITVRFRHVEMT